MRFAQTLFALAVLALAAVAGTPARASAQTMVCTTTTKTITYYFSDGSYAVDERSVKFCQPI